jgi:spermidine/putrescine transport system substrate-binding protein
MGWQSPKEGYVGWIDGDMLVKGSPNRDAALAWLNHIHSPEYVATNFKRLQRGSVNRAGVELLKAQGMIEMVRANLMDQPEMALKMRLIEAPANQDEYAAAWNEVLAAS